MNTRVLRAALTLGTRALMENIADAAKARGFDQARVDVKVNARGELVIAVLIPPRTPNEWIDDDPSDMREAKRASNARR